MGKLEDSYRHKGLRAKLVEEISRKGITDERVLAAIGKVPRHLFMESGFINFSYKDSAFPIGAGQTISQPYTVAFQTQLLEVWPMDKVLEIGTGSGYQTAVLLEMGARVYTIERQRELYLKSKALLEQMGYNPHFFYGDGYQGKPSYGPYAKILITAAAPEIPQALVDQLEVGGRMVLPLGDTMGQDMTLVEKISPTETRVTAHGRFIFVPMLKGTQR
ncbi:MAG TPA: protein-L-isoaspartate(D-aspartate) O-methyltransferase [Tenuifilaceae bacterium]|nr:protein-L-isoaspartate(D-aspartate) O-methyltransferase [Bacteroidales bacterium]HNV82386.1 protein-L-isoaspartate(D-aspartate) O-methyltransferase [Tenuifilaceae bacterium]HOU64160.1 protein-L-isoaspartate(D-aspartate) O-methyltransferase [Tenuifilaceae bacterium]HPW50470.1 protein-L-isoaspartate(D-aspartate) O-methyltransferase [Tenuifilaceae bacterium]